MYKLLLYEVGTEKSRCLNFSRQIPIDSSRHNKTNVFTFSTTY